MKKIVYLTFLTISMSIIISCNQDDYEVPYGDFSTFQWITTEGFDDEETDYVSALNDYLGFRDLSRNALESNWLIPSGTRLLSNDFTENDSIYSDFIIASGPLSSSEDLVNVLFVESGVKEIALRNVFRDSVVGATQQENGNWLVEQTFTVTVFDDVNPAFKVMKGLEEVLSVTANDMPSGSDSASWPTITIEAGEQLTYVDMTTIGEPDNRWWYFNGASIDSSNVAEIDVSYNGLGNFTAGSITSRRTNNEKPEGEGSKLIPLNIEVIPSSQPLVINTDITESETEIISFNVSGEIAILNGEEGNFVVNVINSASGFNQDIAVQSASVNTSDATQIDLILSAPIYNTDEITVTYTAGNIVSVDSRTLESFGPEPVEMFFTGDILNPQTLGYEVPWDGTGNQFEKANTEGYLAPQNADNAAGPIYYFRDESMAFDGASSMKFETPDTGIPNNARLRAFDFIALNGSGVNAGNYIPTVWVFLETGNTMTEIQYNFQQGPVLTFDLSTLPRGEWVRAELPIENFPAISGGRIDLNIRNTNQPDAQVQKMWIDKFDLLIAEPRL